jgi:hypothetical protein
VDCACFWASRSPVCFVCCQQGEQSISGARRQKFWTDPVNCFLSIRDLISPAEGRIDNQALQPVHPGTGRWSWAAPRRPTSRRIERGSESLRASCAEAQRTLRRSDTARAETTNRRRRFRASARAHASEPSSSSSARSGVEPILSVSCLISGRQRATRAPRGLKQARVKKTVRGAHSQSLPW